MPFNNCVTTLKKIVDMNKTHHLLQMAERPFAYTESQWLEILSDAECRESYALMAMTKGFYSAQRDISDEEMESEWKRLVAVPVQTSGTKRKLMRAAAVITGVLMLSGIAFATVRMVRKNGQKTAAVEMKETTTTANIESKRTAATAQPVVFDNVPLSRIVHDIAACHNMQSEVMNKEAGKLRFYFVWKPQDSLQKVVGQLNQFKRVNIVVENNKLVVK